MKKKLKLSLTNTVVPEPESSTTLIPKSVIILTYTKVGVTSSL